MEVDEGGGGGGENFATAYLEVDLGDGIKRMTFRIFTDRVPRTAENFLRLCDGSKGVGKKTGANLHYKGSPFHRIIKGFMVQGGDISKGNGKGGESIYGGNFDDEDMTLKHDRVGLLSMANKGKNTNGSQFFITCAEAPHLDGKHVVFGELMEGRDALESLEFLETNDAEVPLKPVTIVDCGILSEPTRDRQQLSDAGTENEDKQAAPRRPREDSPMYDDGDEEEDKKSRDWPSGVHRRGRGSFKFVTEEEQDRGVTVDDRHGPNRAPAPKRLHRERRFAGGPPLGGRRFEKRLDEADAGRGRQGPAGKRRHQDDIPSRAPYGSDDGRGKRPRRRDENRVGRDGDHRGPGRREFSGQARAGKDDFRRGEPHANDVETGDAEFDRKGRDARMELDGPQGDAGRRRLGDERFRSSYGKGVVSERKGNERSWERDGRGRRDPWPRFRSRSFDGRDQRWERGGRRYRDARRDRSLD
uniref:peptidylprolyl isomerase n=1 Tax=Rhodosorus marinus TaxID=101924 RepID=A0A7S3EC85_9RHOD|mmetsp:Transcript_22153/g.89702  ORF Transcript_22153/g.89702 Transcript_22153/m.89702 type:complete len:472 (+) Transcript_22153:87-1502(+)